MIDFETGRRWQYPRPLQEREETAFSEQFWLHLDRALRRCEGFVQQGPHKLVCGLQRGHRGKHRPPSGR